MFYELKRTLNQQGENLNLYQFFQCFVQLMKLTFVEKPLATVMKVWRPLQQHFDADLLRKSEMHCIVDQCAQFYRSRFL